MHELEHRLARLERQNRTLRRWLVALTVVFGVAMFAGAAAQKISFGDFDAVKADMIHTKQLTISERDEGPRINMSAVDGQQYMIFNDGRHTRLQLAILDGTAQIRMTDKRGKDRLSALVPPGATTAVLQFTNAKGKIIHRIRP